MECIITIPSTTVTIIKAKMNNTPGEKLTPNNADQYIGCQIMFKSGPQRSWNTATILGVSDTGKSIRVDYPSLKNCLQLVHRNIYLYQQKKSTTEKAANGCSRVSDNDDDTIAEQFNYNWRPPALN